MYQTDILEILGILTELGYRDERMQEAIRLVAGKADTHSRWNLESTFNDHFIVPPRVLGLLRERFRSDRRPGSSIMQPPRGC